jgi:hypothetical protein
MNLVRDPRSVSGGHRERQGVAAGDAYAQLAGAGSDEGEAGAEDQVIITYQAEPGTASAAALARLL